MEESPSIFYKHHMKSNITFKLKRHLSSSSGLFRRSEQERQLAYQRFLRGRVIDCRRVCHFEDSKRQKLLHDNSILCNLRGTLENNRSGRHNLHLASPKYWQAKRSYSKKQQELAHLRTVINRVSHADQLAQLYCTVRQSTLQLHQEFAKYEMENEDPIQSQQLTQRISSQIQQVQDQNLVLSGKVSKESRRKKQLEQEIQREIRLQGQLIRRKNQLSNKFL